jgi:hypothetical protein
MIFLLSQELELLLPRPARVKLVVSFFQENSMPGGG